MTDTGGWAAAQLREAIQRGDLPVDVMADSGLIDTEAHDILHRIERHSPDGRDDPRFKRIAMRYASKSIREGVVRGHSGIINHATGINGGDNIDMADWRKYEQLKDLFRQKPKVNPEFTNNIFQSVIFSSAIPPTGRGKSNTMYTLTEFAQSVHPDIRVMSNNTSDPFETVSEDWQDIEKSIRDHDGWQLLLIDEAAQFLQYADQGAGKTVSKMLKLLRHNHCHLIMVGHTGMDIPADIRRQVFVLNKKTMKKGILGYGVTSSSTDNRMEVAEEVLRLTSIPETEIGYDDIGDEGIEIKFDGGDGETTTDTPTCAAKTNAGDPCPADAKYPTDNPQYCYNHRHHAERQSKDADSEHDNGGSIDDGDVDGLDGEKATDGLLHILNILTEVEDAENPEELDEILNRHGIDPDELDL